MDIVKYDRIPDDAVVADINLFEQQRVLDGSVDDGSARNQRVAHARARVVLCGRQIVDLGINIGILLEEVVAHRRIEEIHICAEILLDRADVAPVLIVLVRVHFLDVGVSDDDVANEIVTLLLDGLLDQFDQLAAADNVDTHREQRLCVPAEEGLLLKRGDPPVFIRLDNAVPGDVRVRARLSADHGHIGLFPDVILDQLIEIHLVYAVARADDNVRLMAVAQE